jgi:hypothetical protein
MLRRVGTGLKVRLTVSRPCHGPLRSTTRSPDKRKRLSDGAFRTELAAE